MGASPVSSVNLLVVVSGTLIETSVAAGCDLANMADMGVVSVTKTGIRAIV